MARSLSISMIVRNEERHLGRALKNVWVFADEIIVLDTGSIDRTREIARDSLATVYDFDWCDDFAKARNKSLHYCTKDLVMWLDADDIIELQDAERLKVVIAQDAGWDVLHLPYQYSPTLRKKPPRIFRNKIGARWIYPIHEKLQFPPGSRHKKDIENICISHNPLRSRTANSRYYLSILEKVVKTNEFKDSNYMLWHIAKEYSNLRIKLNQFATLRKQLPMVVGLVAIRYHDNIRSCAAVSSTGRIFCSNVGIGNGRLAVSGLARTLLWPCGDFASNR